MKKKWEDPAYRKKQMFAMKESWTEGRKRKLRERMRGNVPSLETIQKISASNIKTWQINHGI